MTRVGVLPMALVTPGGICQDAFRVREFEFEGRIRSFDSGLFKKAFPALPVMSPTCRSLRPFVIVGLLTKRTSIARMGCIVILHHTDFDIDQLTYNGEVSWRFALQLMVSVVSGV
jgi:hypothetical protein